MRKVSLALVVLFVGLCTVSPFGQSVMPMPRIAFYDSNGNPCAGCLLHAYVAGTTTNQNTFTDSALSVPNANPVVLDSAGRATVFLNNTLNYKFTLSTAADVPIWTVDNITGQLSGIVSITAADTRGLRITRASADAGLSIASTGGSGKTYGITSTTVGSLVIRDDADGTPNITINSSDQIVLTATGGVSTPNQFSVSGPLTALGSMSASATITPPQLTANQNDYGPTGLNTAFRVRLTTDAVDRTLTGLLAQQDGRMESLCNVNAIGGNNVVIASESASSAAANRFASTDAIGPGHCTIYQYDGTSSRWRGNK